MEKLVLSIDGMSCGHCLNSVRHALETVPGAHVDQVSIGSARVTYDPARASTPAITAAVAEAGYRATAVA